MKKHRVWGQRGPAPRDYWHIILSYFFVVIPFEWLKLEDWQLGPGGYWVDGCYPGACSHMGRGRVLLFVTYFCPKEIIRTTLVCPPWSPPSPWPPPTLVGRQRCPQLVAHKLRFYLSWAMEQPAEAWAGWAVARAPHRSRSSTSPAISFWRGFGRNCSSPQRKLCSDHLYAYSTRQTMSFVRTFCWFFSFLRVTFFGSQF